MIMDKLYENVKSRGNVCVGLDTSIDYIPSKFIGKYSFVDDAVFRFNQRIIDATFENAACYKLQIAFYEAMGLRGLRIYKRTLEYIRHLGGIAIADIKRGDISSTASAYARAHFEGDFESDIITLNPYMGMDSLNPYKEYLKNKEKGIFLLMRTSNPGAHDIQYIETCDGKKVYNKVAEMIVKEGREFIGKREYSAIGAVVGCTHSEEALNIRNSMKNTFFLIPGYGAQGGSAADVANYITDGNGGIVNSSRGILMAYKKYENGESEFEICAAKETARMRKEIENAVRS